jgi:thiol-disulfide isomerase/thioredoxin
MKIYFLILFTFLSFLSFAQKTFKLNIAFQNPPSESVYIETFNKGWFQKKTIPLSNDIMKFETDIEQLEFFKISFNQNAFIVILALPGDNISVSADMSDLFKSILVQGSPHTALLYNVERNEHLLQMKIDSIIAEYNALPENLKTAENAAQYQEKIDVVITQKQKDLINYVQSNSSSPACLFFIEKLDIGSHISLYDEVATNLTKSYPQNPIIKSFSDKLANEKLTGVGATAPDIRLPGVNSDTLSLYPLKGKIVIIDFWASWCGPCRRENPHKVQVYNQYKDKGLEFYSVSLDNNEAGWKNAIVSDKLDWSSHVSELKGWQSVTSRMYGVSSIPANVIIDGNGKIIAKNLRGKQLDDFIQEKLK